MTFVQSPPQPPIPRASTCAMSLPQASRFQCCRGASPQIAHGWRFVHSLNAGVPKLRRVSFAFRFRLHAGNGSRLSMNPDRLRWPDRFIGFLARGSRGSGFHGGVMPHPVRIGRVSVLAYSRSCGTVEQVKVHISEAAGGAFGVSGVYVDADEVAALRERGHANGCAAAVRV